MFLIFLGGFWFCLWLLMHRQTPENPGFATLPPLNEGQRPVTVIPEAPPPKSIVIDPGHGGEDPGTQGNGMFERQGTLPIGLALAKELRNRRYNVVLTRDTDSTLSLESRAKIANEPGRVCFVSIHLNYSDTPKSNGIETYYGWPKRWDVLKDLRQSRKLEPDQDILDHRSKLLAEAIHRSALASTRATDREVRNNPALLVLNSIRVPSVLVECGFVSNKSEAEKIQTAEYQENLARGIADGIEQYLNAASSNADYGIEIVNTKATGGKK